jgi:hypothetical protein
MAIDLGAPIPGIRFIRKYPLRSLGILMVCLSILGLVYYRNYPVFFLGLAIGVLLSFNE